MKIKSSKMGPIYSTTPEPNKNIHHSKLTKLEKTIVFSIVSIPLVSIIAFTVVATHFISKWW